MKKKLTLALFGFLLIAYSSFGQHRQQMLTLDERINLSEIIIEGEVIEKESYFDHSDTEIYTINRIKIYKQFKGNYLPDEISLVTAGGQVGDTIERVFHSFQVSTGTKGVFFFKQSRINHPLNDFPNQTQEVISTHGFIRYYSVDYSENLVAGSAYEDFDNIEIDLLQEIERKVGKKRTVKNLTDKEQALQNWINSNSFTKNGNGNGSIVEYTIANPSLTGAFNEYLEFDINIASLLNSEEFFSGELLIDYNALTFGSNLAASGIITITKGSVIVAPNYTITVSDVTPSKLKIEVTSSSNNPNTLYLIDNTADQLVHLKIDITNLAGSTGISFDEINMQSASEFFDISSNVVEPFELVKADDELNVDVNALIMPTIIDFYPKTVRGGIDTITIVGTGFGQFQNFSGGLTYVEFTNAENGPSPVEWIRPHHKEYALWTNDTIKVKVTSYGKNDPDWTYPWGDYYAGTGKIRIRTPNGVSNVSNSTLKVNYSIYNDIVNDNGVYYPSDMVLVDINNNGGYTLTFDTSFTNNVLVSGAQDAFERALKTWRCQTGVNFIINDTIPNTPGNNEILITFDNSLPVGTPARTALWLFLDCSNPHAYMRKFTMKFSSNKSWYTGVDTSIIISFLDLDFETVALHELGHAHLLNHTNNKWDLMWYGDRPLGHPYLRNLDINSKNGGLHIIDISAMNPPNNCLTPMSIVPSSECDIIDNTEDLLVNHNLSIYPNPSNNTFTIEQSNDYAHLEILKIYNTQGQLLKSETITSEIQQVSVEELTKGIYILVISNSKGISISKKLIKY